MMYSLKDTWLSDTGLYIWTSAQIVEYKRGNLSDERTDDLNSQPRPGSFLNNLNRVGSHAQD